MKNIILLLFNLFLGSGICISQNLSPTVIASAGTVYSNGTHSISWTLGEIAISTINSGSNILTQGFHQPELNIPIDINDRNGQNLISVFPNPVNDNLILSLSATVNENIKVEILDLLGRMIKTETFSSGSTETKHVIQVSELATGLYWLKVSSINNKHLKTFKVTKA